MSAVGRIVGDVRRLLGRAQRRCAAPFGIRALRRAMAHGFPANLEEPVRFLFTGELSARAKEARARIERRRGVIAAQTTTYVFAHASTPHGPARWPVEQTAGTAGPHITSRWLAHVASVPERWGLFLHLCATASGARTVVELGSSIGIAAAYLASGESCRSLITLEGSPALAELARATLAEVTGNASVIVGPFDDGLTAAFGELGGSRLDLVYVDGHHDEAATLHYTQRLVPYLRSGALLIFDDIYLYEEMWRAWQRLRMLPGVAAAVNVGRFGILLWAGGDTQAVGFDFSRYTGWWRVGGSRTRAMRPPA